jgi:hypothetical protein
MKILNERQKEFARVKRLWAKRTFPVPQYDLSKFAFETDCDNCVSNEVKPDHCGRAYDRDGFVVHCNFESLPKCCHCGSPVDVSYSHNLACYLCYECMADSKKPVRFAGLEHIF